MFEKLREMSKSGNALIVLLGIFVWFEFYQISRLVQYLDFSNSISVYTLIVTALTIFIKTIIIYIFERKQSFFVSNLLLLIFFVPEDFKNIFSIFQYRDEFFSLIPIILNISIAVYAILKIYAHKDELNYSIKKPDQKTFILITLSLISVYYDFDIATLALYILLYIAILMNSRPIETLLLSAYIYIIRIFSDIRMLILYSGFNEVSIRMIISLVISSVILYFIIKTYLDQQKNNISYDDYLN